MKKAILLLSGGLDSATCGAIARNRGYSLYAMSFYYGQKHSFEITAARKIAKKLNVLEHKIITIDLKIFGASSLTSSEAVPKNRNLKTDPVSSIPNTYVPARNTIFLSYALAWAEVINCTDIFIGVNAVDYSGYPDCRPEYIESFEHMANLATKAGIEGNHLKIHTPLVQKTKKEIIQKGISLGIDYSLTVSCYDPPSDGIACGLCDSCQLRKKGFAESGNPDPTKYLPEN
jgi:7-cyano-7-deazaguanine synthase